jgi:ureidoglycolate dehydrogenase (NAD+)
MVTVTVSVGSLREFCASALTAAGMSAVDAATSADALVMADSMGVFTHGSKLLRDYVRRVRAGGIRTDVRPEIASEGPAWAVVEAHSVMGHVAGAFAMRLAVAKARVSGIGYVGVRNTNHFGAAGYYAWIAAAEGLIGVAMANDAPSVAAPGSRGAVTGSNPLAYALPAGDSDPIVLDMATSAAAGGKVYAATQRGEPIPGDWLIGPDGRPTTDGRLYPLTAALAPMAGHKGYGIALLIEVLSGVLTGAGVTKGVGSWIFGDPARPTNHGAAFLAIDIGSIVPRDVYASRVEALIREIHAAPTADGVDRVLLPGEREWSHRRRAMEHGIDLPPDVVAKLAQLARESGLTPGWLTGVSPP